MATAYISTPINESGYMAGYLCVPGHGTSADLESAAFFAKLHFSPESPNEKGSSNLYLNCLRHHCRLYLLTRYCGQCKHHHE